MSEAQRLILEALRKSLPPFDGFDHACAVASAEIDKALGGLTREEMEGVRVGDDPRLEPYRESRWLSGWTEAG